MTENIYARDLSQEEVDADFHRVWVGGLWEEIGRLQFEFLVARGLKPSMKLLDIGCGAFRGGVHFLRYLDIGHYFAVDRNRSLLHAGLSVELPAAGIADRLPGSNVLCTDRFDFAPFETQFDMALAHSVFTHVDIHLVRLCLANLAPAMREDGVFYATFFERPAKHPADEPFLVAKMNVETFSAADPYNYSMEDMRYVVRDLPWTIEYIGEWDHPRGQNMLAFHKSE